MLPRAPDDDLTRVDPDPQGETIAEASAVEPTRSAKRTVATFLSSAGSGSCSTGAAQLGQKRASAGSSAPHFAQVAMPHSPAKQSPLQRSARTIIKRQECALRWSVLVRRGHRASSQALAWHDEAGEG